MYVSGKSLNGDDDDEDDNDGGGNENDYWYMGSTPRSSAQVAYTLYGVKKDAATGGLFTRNNANSKAGGCQSHTYINSFYTSAGFTAFTGSLYAAGVDGFSNYAAGGGEEEDDDAISATCKNGQGIVCTASGGFVHNQYSQSGDGDDDATVCDANHLVAVVDEMKYLNAALQETGCYQIYDSATAVTAANDNGEKDQTGRQLQPSAVAADLLGFL